MMRPPRDPVERVIYDALVEAQVNFIVEKDHDPRSCDLDFYLPDIDLHIECKRGHSDRTADQIRRSDNIILIVGMDAARHYAGLLRFTNNEKHGH